MACTAAIFGLNSVEQIFRREDWIWSCFGGAPQVLGKSDETDFSGENLEQERYHVVVTATFSHSSRWHYVNNMIMLGAIGPQLEAVVGPWKFLAMYTGTGAAGWALTFLRNRYDLTGSCPNDMTAEDRWNWGLKFASSNGASPATYGLAIAAACLVAPSAAVGPFSAAESITAANPWLSWSSTALAVYAAAWLDAKDSQDFLLPVAQGAAAIAMHSYVSSRGSDAQTIKVVSLSAVSWLVLYHFRTFTVKVFNRLLKPDDHDASDHACHLGGSIAGLAAAAYVKQGNPLPEGTLSKVAVGASMAYLFGQFWAQKQ